MNRSTQKAIENKVAEAKTKSLNMRAAVEKGVRLSALFSEMKSISQRTLDVSLVLRSPELGAALQTLKRGEVPSGDDYCGPYVEIVPSILNGDLSEQAITTLASHSELAEYRASQAYFSRLLAEYTQLYSSVPAAYRAYYPYQGGPRSPEQVYAPDSQVFKAMQAVIADKINRATLALQAEMTARRKLRLAYQEFRDTTMQAMLVKHVREAYPDLAERSLELALEADEGESCTVIFE